MRLRAIKSSRSKGSPASQASGVRRRITWPNQGRLASARSPRAESITGTERKVKTSRCSPSNTWRMMPPGFFPVFGILAIEEKLAHGQIRRVGDGDVQLL